MNPLNAREQIQLSEDHPLPNPPLGIPGLVSSDAIVAAYVALMQDQCDRKNDMIQGIYGKLIADWKDNNSRGISNPAPGPMTLVHLDQAAAADYERTGTGAAKLFLFYDQWDPAVPPGTIYAPPPAPPPPAKTAEHVGDHVPGTSSLFFAAGGPYTPSELGNELTTDNGRFVLINSTPMGFRPMWLKQ